MPIYIGDPDGISWADAAAKVRGDLWRPGNSLPDDNVNRALHASCLDLEGEAKWLWLEELTAIATVDVEADGFDLPPTVSRVTGVSYRDGDWPDPLDEQPLKTVRANIGNDVGPPSAYAQGSGRIWLNSRVEAGTTFEMIVTAATPRRLELALQSPSITLAIEQQAVIARACYYLALNFMKNADEAARQNGVYNSIVERLHDVEADTRGGMIQPDTWGMGRYG